MHNVRISRKTLLHGFSYAMSILRDKLTSKDHLRKVSFRPTSFANLHETHLAPFSP